MLLFIALTAATGTFTLYPGPAAPDSRIEAITQRGPIYEMIVRCDEGSAIMTYSPVEQLYCSPLHVCSSNRTAVIARSCSGGTSQIDK